MALLRRLRNPNPNLRMTEPFPARNGALFSGKCCGPSFTAASFSSSCSSPSSPTNGGHRIYANASFPEKSSKSPVRFSSGSAALDRSLAGGDVIKNPPFQSLHKAIIAGKVGMPPVQRIRKNGKVITTFSVATGGMWRLPLPSQASADSNYLEEGHSTESCVQYHKIAIHDEGLGRYALRTLKKGMQVYVEGELEVRVFNDADTGAVKRDHEVAVDATGKILALDQKDVVPSNMTVQHIKNRTE